MSDSSLVSVSKHFLYYLGFVLAFVLGLVSAVGVGVAKCSHGLNLEFVKNNACVVTCAKFDKEQFIFLENKQTV